MPITYLLKQKILNVQISDDIYDSLESQGNLPEEKK